ncbi:MAG: CdaR family protein [Dysgonomonas sp.]
MGKKGENISKKVRIDLSGITWRKILTFSFFILLATIFWLMQVYRQPFETTLSIPIKYTNIPDDIVFDQDLPQVTTMRIKDDGAALFRYFFTKRNDTLTVNVKKFLETNKNTVIQGATLEALLRNKLFTSSEIKNYSPVKISLEHSSLMSKKVPIIFDGQIVIDPGYLLNGDIMLKPDSATVYGSQESLNTITYAYTSNDTIKNLKSEINLPVNLKIPAKVKLVPNRTNLYIPIDKLTEKIVIVPISCINMPKDMEVKLFPSTVQVSFAVGLTQYKDITENNFSIELDYNDLKNIKSMITPIRLTASPAVGHIHNITLTPSEIEFVFEKKQ